MKQHICLPSRNIGPSSPGCFGGGSLMSIVDCSLLKATSSEENDFLFLRFQYHFCKEERKKLYAYPCVEVLEIVTAFRKCWKQKCRKLPTHLCKRSDPHFCKQFVKLVQENQAFFLWNQFKFNTDIIISSIHSENRDQYLMWRSTKLTLMGDMI